MRFTDIDKSDIIKSFGHEKILHLSIMNAVVIF